MAKKESLEEVLKQQGFGDKEAESLKQVLESYKADMEAEKTLYKKSLDEANEKFLKQEIKKLDEAAKEQAKMKYLADMDKAKGEIQKECEAKAMETAKKNMAAITEQFAEKAKLQLQKDTAEWKSKYVAECDQKSKEKLEKVCEVLDGEFKDKMNEALSMYKAELMLDATNKLNKLEENIVHLVDENVRTHLNENLSQSDIKKYAINEVNGKAISAVMRALEENFVAPDSYGDKQLKEKDEQLDKLRNELAKKEESEKLLKENIDKMSKEKMINEELKNLPSETKEKLALITESIDFNNALETVKAMAKAYEVLNESAAAGAGAAAAPEKTAEKTEDDAKKVEQAKQILEMFNNPEALLENASGIKQEASDSNAEAASNAEKPLNESVPYDKEGFDKRMIKALRARRA